MPSAGCGEPRLFLFDFGKCLAEIANMVPYILGEDAGRIDQAQHIDRIEQCDMAVCPAGADLSGSDKNKMVHGICLHDHRLPIAIAQRFCRSLVEVGIATHDLSHHCEG